MPTRGARLPLLWLRPDRCTKNSFESKLRRPFTAPQSEGDDPFQTFLIQATASYAATYLFVMTTAIAQLVKPKSPYPAFGLYDLSPIDALDY